MTLAPAGEYVRGLKLSNLQNTYRLEITPIFKGNSKRPFEFEIELFENGDIIEVPESFNLIPNPL